MTMRFLIVLVCVLAVCKAELDEETIKKFLEKVKKVGEECRVEAKASEDDVKTLMEHKIPESHEGKCMIFCYHKSFNIQKEDGSLDKEGYRAFIEPIKEKDAELYDKIKNIQDACQSTDTDEDPCIYASKLAECCAREAKKVGIENILFQ